jgi:hypothetical protein
MEKNRIDSARSTREEEDECMEDFERKPGRKEPLATPRHR